MKFFTRGLILFVLSLGMFVVVGCGVDNEEEGKKLAKQAGDPGPANPKALPTERTEPPKTEADRGKQLTAQKQAASQGYPGAKK